MKKTDLDLLGERIVIPVGKTEPRELPLARGAGETSSAWACAELMLGFNDKKKGELFMLPDPMALLGEKPRAKASSPLAPRFRHTFLDPCTPLRCPGH
jgi:hypothetical protein